MHSGWHATGAAGLLTSASATGSGRLGDPAGLSAGLGPELLNDAGGHCHGAIVMCQWRAGHEDSRARPAALRCQLCHGGSDGASPRPAAVPPRVGYEPLARRSRTCVGTCQSRDASGASSSLRVGVRLLSVSGPCPVTPVRVPTGLASSQARPSHSHWPGSAPFARHRGPRPAGVLNAVVARRDVERAERCLERRQRHSQGHRA